MTMTAKRACMIIGTLNNPTADTKDYLEAWSKKKTVAYVTGQLERGDNGTPHIQYFVQTTGSNRMAWFKTHCSKSHF